MVTCDNDIKIIKQFTETALSQHKLH